MDYIRAQHLTNQQLAQEAWDHQRPRVLRGLRRIIYATGAFRVYADGDIFRAQLRWWHPVCWAMWLLLLPVAIVASVFSTFTVISIYSEYSWRPSKYLRDHPEHLFYVK